MPNDILSERGSTTAMTITLASLPSSTAFVGRQATLITNASPCKPCVWVLVQLTQGSSPTGNRNAYVYGIRGDGTYRDGLAGASDAALTVTVEELLETLPNKASPSTGDVLRKWIRFDNPGPEWGIAIVHDTGVNLNSSGGNHVVAYSYENPEIAA